MQNVITSRVGLLAFSINDCYKKYHALFAGYKSWYVAGEER